MLLTNTKVSKIRKVFTNSSSANIKIWKSQLHKIGELAGFLGRLLRSLLKSGLPLIGNVLKPLAKNVLKPLGLTPAALAKNAAIHNKVFGSRRHLRMLASLLSDLSKQTTLTISNEEMNDIMKIVKSLKESGW